MPRPSHHTSGGRYRSPWPEAAGDEELRSRFGKVALEWVRGDHPPDPTAADLPIAPWAPSPGAPDDGEARITWVGHASFLLELPDATFLTDPVWSTTVSPVPWIGSRRFVPASPAFELLPEVDAVLLSHDHFDHLDLPTVRRLHRRFGDQLQWFTPLGYRTWFRRAGIHNLTELDWWESAPGPGNTVVTGAPARHWTRRTPWGTNTRLWSSWVIDTSEDRHGPPHPRIYFGGDTAYASHLGEVGERLGPFDASLLPIGAYEPRWFMKASHMNPEEAVRAYEDLGSNGDFIPSHWGTFRLTFEDPLEPPERTRAAWTEAGLDEARLRIPRHGETLRVTR